MGAQHIPVLLNECLEFLNCKTDGIYVDATVGNAGHAKALLETYPRIHKLVGIDRDHEAIERAHNNLKQFSRKVLLLQGNFRHIKTILDRAGVRRIDGILLDLGISTAQLEDSSRGFSFNREGPLDMRMDKKTCVPAKSLLSQLSPRDLEKTIRTYGEERWAKSIARNIKAHLRHKPIELTSELADIVTRSIPARYHPKKIHPATRTFQALRIAVNDELGAIEEGLGDVIDLLQPGARMCVISFHSLEDRIVKNMFRQWQQPCTCSPRMPVCTCGGIKKLTIITKKPVVPSREEVLKNPRARSAKLRVGERI